MKNTIPFFQTKNEIDIRLNEYRLMNKYTNHNKEMCHFILITTYPIHAGLFYDPMIRRYLTKEHTLANI